MKAKIKFLDAKKILNNSSGEITQPGTISYKNRSPKPGGLLCPKIFGPIKDYKCSCNPPTLKGVRHAGLTCEKCGVTILPAKVRRERTGHIILPSPCVHPLAYVLISDIMGIPLYDLKEIILGHIWVGWTKNPKGTIFLRDGSRVSPVVKDQRDMEASERSSMALFHMVKLIDLPRTAELHRKLRLKTAPFLRKTVEENESLENLFITVLPVMPVAFRPYLDQGDFIITNSKNDLYSRMYWKKNRFGRIRDLYPLFGKLDIVMQEETTLIQKALNELMITGCSDVRGGHLKSIAEDIQGIKGKFGLVRNKLLGKRADFSGRTVISPGPWLSMDEMGLPIKMGVELFKPWIQRWLKQNYNLSIKQSDALYKKGKKKDTRLYEALEEVVKGKRLIMNRAPTLHRIGMLSFKIRLHNGHSCFLHPMVCAPYNADFDGDQMAVHIPLSKEVEEELSEMMVPQDNILSPLNSSPVIGPSHEMIIGAYYMTKMTGEPRRTYDNPLRVIEDHERGMFEVNTPVYLREDDEITRTTCAGRLMFERLFKVEINSPLTKKTLKNLISCSYDVINCGALAIALDKLKVLAYKYVTMKGFSVGMTDFLIPSTRDSKMEEAQKYADVLKEQHNRGEITEDERVERKIRKWMGTISELQNDFVSEAGDENPLVVMLETGARVSMTQVSQLVVAKGMQARAGGTIIEDPVKNCLMTGVNTFEYFTTSYGARKSMADKKMATPTSGYLARRLVNVTRDFYISVKDCGNNEEGIILRKCDAVGRTDLNGELIQKNKSQDYIKVRSPIFCKAERGICTVCYGIDQSTRKRVEIGEPAGIVSAQSLTEPCTQMTMKTFHTSGAAELKDSPLVVHSRLNGVVNIIEKENHTIIMVNFSKYIVHKDLCKILVKKAQRVKEGDPLAIYTSKNLVNQDIGGKLDVLNHYYEMTPCRSFEAIVAKKDGEINLVVNDEHICVFIDGNLQGTATEVPIFVYDGEIVRKGQFLSYGEVNIKDFEDDLELAGTVFVHRMVDLYAEEGVYSKPIHLEMIFRGLSELVEKEPGVLGLYRYKDPGTRKIFGATELGRLYPSWLKAIGFGYSKSALTRAAINYAVTYDLPTERIMMGEYPLFDPVESE